MKGVAQDMAQRVGDIVPGRNACSKSHVSGMKGAGMWRDEEPQYAG